MVVSTIKTTAVIGAGIMGAGIAQVFAASGVEVIRRFDFEFGALIFTHVIWNDMHN